MVRGRLVRGGLVCVVSALLLVACGGGSGHGTAKSSTTGTGPSASGPAYSGPGPYAVSLTTLNATTREIDIFYPAREGSQKGRHHATYDIRSPLHDPAGKPLSHDLSQLVTLAAFSNLPPAPGPFPVVLFAHGYGGFPLQDATLETDLAAWGFVVVAPDLSRSDTRAVAQGKATINDARDAMQLSAALSATEAVPSLGPILDASHVAAVGHEQGGATALAALALPAVDTAVAWASVAPTEPVAHKPVMLLGASHDLEYGSDYQRRIYAGLAAPKRLVLIGGGAGNATFNDACADMWATDQLTPGGDVGSQNHLLDLATNGCYPDEVDPRLVWPAIVHLTVAQLRSVFGIDPAPVGLDDSITSAFPKVPLRYEHQP